MFMREDHIFCPICDDVTYHKTIKSEPEHLVICTSCGNVHSAALDRTKLASLRVNVSKEGSTERYQIHIPEQELLRVGDELVVDDESRAVVLVQITSLESDHRIESSQAGMVKTVWARAIDEVSVKLSIHKGGRTRSFKYQTKGDQPFEVGEIKKLGTIRCRVDKIKLRSGGFAEKAKARDILRIWGQQL
jgi:uncharacterized Zn finger protein